MQADALAGTRSAANEKVRRSSQIDDNIFAGYGHTSIDQQLGDIARRLSSPVFHFVKRYARPGIARTRQGVTLDHCAN